MGGRVASAKAYAGVSIPCETEYHHREGVGVEHPLASAVGNPAAFGGAPHGRLEVAAWLGTRLNGLAAAGTQDPSEDRSLGIGAKTYYTNLVSTSTSRLDDTESARKTSFTRWKAQWQWSMSIRIPTHRRFSLSDLTAQGTCSR